jgi:hypothetical protein
MSWGKEFIALAPGEHSIRVGYRLLGRTRAASASFNFTVTNGQVSKIRWRAPLRGTKGYWKDLGALG